MLKIKSKIDLLTAKNGKIQWILLQDIGKTQICDTVDENIIKKAIQLSL